MVDDEDDRLVEHPPQPLVGYEDASGLDVRDLRSDGREEKEEGGVRDASSGDGEGRNGNSKSGNVKFQMRNGVRNAEGNAQHPTSTHRMSPPVLVEVLLGLHDEGDLCRCDEGILAGLRQGRSRGRSPHRVPEATKSPLVTLTTAKA